MLAGVAGLVAGAMSMAAGEFVSVSSQRDTELADIEIEKEELATEPRRELKELTAIYMKRGLDKDLALKVARQLTARDALEAHMRDELGLEQTSLARPMQAALTSAASFASFALIPIVALIASPSGLRIPFIAGLSLASLAALGALGGYLGGAPVVRAAVRVTIGGALAMAATAGIGRLFGVAAG
jgi:VIT1/CCC1 family predicted Fe2+/Mn2+ transporter